MMGMLNFLFDLFDMASTARATERLHSERADGLRAKMMADQMRWHAEMERLGAKALTIKPDGEIIPIY